MSVKYVGLDVHQSSTSYCVKSEKGKVVSQGMLETSPAYLKDFVRGLSGEVHLTFEEGTQASWLYDLLKPYVAELVVCDPRKNATKHKGNKSDRIDAERLAELLRLGSLSPVYHGEHGTRALKELVRAHRDLVRDVVRVKNRIKAVYRSRGISCAGNGVYGREGREEHLSQLAGGGLRQRVEWQLEQLDKLEDLRVQSEKLMQKEARRHRGCRVLRSVPGIGPIRAAQLVGVVDTPHRFRTKRHFWSYVGLAVVMRSSSDYVSTAGGFVRKNWQSTRGLNRQCNRFLKGVYKGASKDAIAQYPGWRAYYEKLVDRGLSPEVARVVVARKLASISLTVWKKGERYTQSKAFK